MCCGSLEPRIFEHGRSSISTPSVFPFTIEHNTQREKTMKHFVVLRFQKVNMCRDGRSVSLSLPFFYMSS